MIFSEDNNGHLTFMHKTLDTTTLEGATGRPTSADVDQDTTLNLHLYHDVGPAAVPRR